MKSLKISPGHVLPYSLLGLLICNMYQREAQSMPSAHIQAKTNNTNPKILVPIVLRQDPLPSTSVEMIAGYGLWPPVDQEEVVQQIQAAKQDHVGRMLVDTGLTELWRAYQTPKPYLKVIAQAAAESRRQQLRTVFYFPSFELRQEKKDVAKDSLLHCCRNWAQVTLDGRPYIKSKFSKEEFWNSEGDEALWVCPNSSWRKRFIELITEVVKRGVDTVFLDVPYFQMEGKHITCRCAHCQALFKQKTGQDIPTKPDLQNATYRQWLWWRHQVLINFFREMRQNIRRINPKARFVIEEYPSYLDESTTATGLDIGLAGPEVDIFAHEYSAKQFDKRPFSYKNRLDLALALALYRGLDDYRPTWVLSYAHDPAGSRTSAALHLAYDASFWETKGPDMNSTSVSRAWRKKLFAWFAQHADAFGQSHQLANVAVLYSPFARDFTKAHFNTLIQTQRVLTEARIPYRILSTRDLDQLKNYHYLILPNVEVMSNKEAERIRSSLVKVITIGSAPKRDEWGLRQLNHHLQCQQTPLKQLSAAITEVPIMIDGSGPIVTNILQRPGEVQIRLANLKPGTTQATIRFKMDHIQRASQLSFLGKETPLTLKRDEKKTVKATVQVREVHLVRLWLH